MKRNIWILISILLFNQILLASCSPQESNMIITPTAAAPAVPSQPKKQSLSNKAKSELHIGDFFSVLETGTLEEITYLIEAGADVHAKDEDGYPPLFYAIINHDSELLSFLLNSGVDVNAKEEDDELTPLLFTLSFALYNADFDNDTLLTFLTSLIDAGADIEAKDEDGLTALMYAVRHEDP
ncbi:MAG: ankyrin repeat domain-containing protein, partial [Candidatus Caldatribacteriota bacterium]